MPFSCVLVKTHLHDFDYTSLDEGGMQAGHPGHVEQGAARQHHHLHAVMCTHN